MFPQNLLDGGNQIELKSYDIEEVLSSDLT